MRKIITTTILTALASSSLFGQNIGIGTATPSSSSKLEISSTNSGLLIPRVALTATNAAGPIAAPATSLLVYNTATVADVTPGYYYWTGTAWTRLLNTTSADWTLTGNVGTVAGTNFIGTTDAVDFVTRTNNAERMRVTSAGNVGIGTASPGYRLDLATGTFAFGNNNVRTETRNDAGLQGNAGAQSGFFETMTPVNYPTGAAGWWHLIEARHFNNTNNFALQIAGSFFNQELWFRKTNGSATQAWTKILTTSNGWSTTGNAGTVAGTNFIGTTDNVDFVTRTNNTERMRVTSAGNVGIGTATPGYRLDLATGTFAFGNNNVRTETRNDAGLQGNAGAQSGFFETMTPVNYPTGAAGWWHLIEARHFNNTNNFALQIAGSFFNQELWFRKTNGSATQAWTKILTTSNGWSTTGNAGTNAATNFIGTIDAVDFVTRTGNAERMRVTSAGNVGIGTTVPGVRLDVSGTIRAYDVFASGGQNIIVGDDTYLTDLDLASTLGLYSINPVLNPRAVLSLGTVSQDPGMVQGGWPNYVHAVGLQTFGNGGRYATLASLGTYGSLTNETGGYFADGNACTIWSPADGNQGQPAAIVYFLDEDGFDAANTNPYDNGALKAYISATGAFLTVSDERKKNSITPITSALSKLKNINGYEYYYNLSTEDLEKGGSQSRQSGVLAQEIQQQIPAAVEQNENGDYFVNYAAILPFVIEGIKEQQRMIEHHESTILSQQQLIDQQAAMLQELKKELEILKKRIK